MESANEQGAPRPKQEQRDRRNQRLRLQVLAFAAGSYTLDAIWLACFWLLGVVAPWVSVVYLGLAAVVVGVFYLLFSRGWNLRFDDQDLAQAQTAAAAALTLGFLVFVPQVGIFFLLNLFVVFAFVSLSVTVRQFVPIWLVMSAATGAALLLRGSEMGLPLATPAQQAVTGLVFASMLGRTVFMALQVSVLRTELYRRHLELHEARERAERLARIDELTQTLNRRAFLEIVDDEAMRALRNRRPFCLAVLDLDRFKSVNDRFGHPAGDRVLAACAAITQGCLRLTDKLGRWGGEEFVLLLPDTPLGGGRVVAERIRSTVKDADWTPIAPGLEVTVSIGIASFRRGETVEQLLERSDFALYVAKREGRDRTVEG